MEGFETGRRGEVGCWLHDCLWTWLDGWGFGRDITGFLMSAHVKDCEEGRVVVIDQEV